MLSKQEPRFFEIDVHANLLVNHLTVEKTPANRFAQLFFYMPHDLVI